MRIVILLAITLLLTTPGFADEPPQIIIKERTRTVNSGQSFFDQRHSDAWAWDAIEELAGTRPAPGAGPELMAAHTAELLSTLPEYGQKSAAMLQPIPDWFVDGYRKYNGASVQRSRYFSGVDGGTLEPDADIAALYAYWSLYDAEWFSLSRKPGFKAWLSAVALTYPPHWIRLRGESAGQLHARLVAPLQTPDEQWREIDNWINNFTKPMSSGELGAFIKPKVRDALVQELLSAAGLETDARFYERRAYGGDAPARVGLDDRKFFLLGALTLEYFQELYAANPDTKQPLHFRDYFVDSFRNAQ